MGERLKNFPIQISFSIARFLDFFLSHVLAHGACLEFHHFHLFFSLAMRRF